VLANQRDRKPSLGELGGGCQADEATPDDDDVRAQAGRPRNPLS
jgi:hypothetical protein